MPIPEAVVLIIVAAVTAVVTTVAGGYVGKRFGVGALAQESAREKSELIADLKTRVELAEADVKQSNLAAEAARLAAAETERRRATCEDEIGRLRGDVRALERELLDLHRRTRTPVPKTLRDREAEHRREDEEDT